MDYNEFKNLCREAWNKKYSYLKIDRLNDDEKYTICNESEKVIQSSNQRLTPF